MEIDSAQGRTEQINGIEMYYEIRGEGEPLALLHGFSGSYLWIIPNGGHGPIFGDMTESFIATASAFLRGEWESK